MTVGRQLADALPSDRIDPWIVIAEERSDAAIHLIFELDRRGRQGSLATTGQVALVFT